MTVRAQRHRSRRALLASSLSGILALAAAAAAEPEVAGAATDAESAKAPVEDAAPKPPPVGLDALLKLPPSAAAAGGPSQQAGDEATWRARFAEARSELTSAEQALEEAQSKLENLASGRESWQVSAPGAKAGSESGPLSFGLRQEIRRQREAVERAQRELDELRIQANLAGVPDAWTAPPVPVE